jgi:AcrR family transcriptional regulator
MAITESTPSSARRNGGAPSADDTVEPTTRDRLIEAAIEVFLENGYAKTRVQDIARRAGLTTGAMYSHFTNKAALLAEAIAQHGDIALNEVVDAMDVEADHGLVAIMIGVRALSGESEPVDRLILEALAVSARDEEEDLVSPALQRMRETMASRADSAHEVGILDERITSDALTAFLQRVVLGSIVGKAVGLPPADPDETEYLLTRMLLSLRPPKPHAPS